ncbi:hypothetical protein CPB85DRAFT_1209445 [Mucidula mucida]|nr:hypothetical protein CPB85DRAFT_1209445 [Mucidula mucida]
MHPSLAPYYSFFGPALDKSRDPFAQDVQIGPSAAFERLQTAGCTLATQEWVDNHWSLILWKLAGLAYLQPEREWYDDQKRWCWDEVYRQLLYRYERELNQGVRPPLRMIATQDAPSVSPMVLCISDILWLPQRSQLDGKLNDRVAELEVTDGWYKIRAQIDAPLMRAINKGKLKVGRKIAVVNAKLDSERKDPQEILEAYGSIKLVLSGNSSHLAPWHAKLGFQTDLPIATMSSLTRDGGMIAAMDLVIAFPIAYFEFVYEGDKKVNNGPLNEQEESRLCDQWQVKHPNIFIAQRKREHEHSKLRENLEKTFRRYAGYAERLERKAGSNFRPSEAGPPDRIDDLYDQLEEPEDAVSVISRVSSSDAGWLAMRIRHQMEKQQETMSEEIDKELNDICPPRDVRSFRVLVVKDARSGRKPANREAQLTVWDVLNVHLAEGRRAGSFQVGECCRVTHLQPTQPSAWMDSSPGAQIFMSTTRNTRWTKLRPTRRET